MSELVFHHQDGDLSFEIVRAGYCLSSSGEFSCSVECADNPNHDYMAAPKFALAHLPSGGRLRSGQAFSVPRAAEEEDVACARPVAHLYAGQHYSPWNTKIVVVSVGPAEVFVRGSFYTTDPNYYDERAKPTHVQFEAKLRRSEAKDLWWPF